MKLYPFKFTPICKEKVWAGEQLRLHCSRIIPPGARIGESWEIADVDNDVSIVENGPLHGASLRDLVAERREELLGSVVARRFPGGFPLIVKYIDASEYLSIQVHPDDAQAAALEKGERGKTELWYVLHADPGAMLLCGLIKGVGRARCQKTIEEGNLPGLLRCLGARDGDAVVVPAGRLHCIGTGILLLEIGTASDITYRLYDWGRAGRQLHIQKGLRVADLKDCGGQTVEKAWEDGDGFRRAVIARCHDFTTEELDIAACWGGMLDGSRFRIISVVKGRGRLTSRGGHDVIDMKRGDNLLLPASLGEYAVTAVGEGCGLLSTEVP